MNLRNKKILVVYFSRRGENYYNGKIVDLDVGNTEVVGGIIAKLTGADIFKIDTTEEYPKDYNECTARAQLELSSNSRPELINDINTDRYDIIFLGYPNWWGTMPMPVWSFLEKHNFSKKTIFPFCTHEGSGMGESENDMKKLCPNADIKKGLAIHGTVASKTELSIKDWIMKG